eukprot:scaffold502652_cov45-Prasinocladus_malaysianus.AAC.2
MECLMGPTSTEVMECDRNGCSRVTRDEGDPMKNLDEVGRASVPVVTVYCVGPKSSASSPASSSSNA